MRDVLGPGDSHLVRVYWVVVWTFFLRLEVGGFDDLADVYRFCGCGRTLLSVLNTLMLIWSFVMLTSLFDKRIALGA